jgi:hypothetical protein
MASEVLVASSKKVIVELADLVADFGLGALAEVVGSEVGFASGFEDVGFGFGFDLGPSSSGCGLGFGWSPPKDQAPLITPASSFSKKSKSPLEKSRPLLGQPGHCFPMSHESVCIKSHQRNGY